MGSTAKDVALEILGLLLLFFLVFGMSATVDIRSMRKQIKNKHAIMTGVFLQFVLLPFLGFAVVRALNMSSAMGLTLLVVTSSPGGSYSNWWCSMFNADLALSVTMTAISTLLSTIMLPINLLVYTSASYESDVVSNLDWMSLFIALGVVIGSICLGLTTSAQVHSHWFNRMANGLGNISGIALVLFSVLVSNSGGEDLEGEAAPRIWDHTWVFYVGVAAPCLLGLILSNVITSFCKLQRPERVTVSVECCYQNVGIATSVALTMFEGADRAEAMAVPLYYGIIEAVFVGLYCVLAWKIGWTKAPADAKIWDVLLRSYEVIEAEQQELQELQEVEVTLADGAFHDNEKTSNTGGTLFHYFKFDVDNICHKFIDENICIKKIKRGDTVDDDEFEEAEYKDCYESTKTGSERIFVRKEPSGYKNIPLNKKLHNFDDSVDGMGCGACGLAEPFQQKWTLRRSRSSNDLSQAILEEGNAPSQSSPLATNASNSIVLLQKKPTMIQRGKTIATEYPSAATKMPEEEATKDNTPREASEVELNYISSSSTSSLERTESDSVYGDAAARYIPPPSPMCSPKSQGPEKKEIEERHDQYENIQVTSAPVVAPVHQEAPEIAASSVSTQVATTENVGDSQHHQEVPSDPSPGGNTLVSLAASIPLPENSDDFTTTENTDDAKVTLEQSSSQ